MEDPLSKICERHARLCLLLESVIDEDEDKVLLIGREIDKNHAALERWWRHERRAARPTP
jgi:hypothetical protein